MPTTWRGSSRSSSQGARRRGPARLLRGRAHAGRASGCSRRPTARSAASSPTAGSAGLLRTRVLARIAAFAMRRERVRAARVPHHLADRHPLPRQPAVADARRAARRTRRAPATAFRGCGCASRPTVRWRTCSTARRHALQPAGDRAGSRRRRCRQVTRCASSLIPDDADQRSRTRAPWHPQPSFYLLRPDGHIALAGTRLQEGEVQRYLSERFSP